MAPNLCCSDINSGFRFLSDFPLLAAGDETAYEATTPAPAPGPQLQPQERERQGEFSGRHVHLT
jgi:hypothetical protein